jgi:CxxC motif-containing protein (DUF1111 family)
MSGRANFGYSLDHQKTMLGRFGWKAAAPTIKDQSAAAFATDMGLSTPLINADYGDCTPQQSECLSHASATDDAQEKFEISQEVLDLVVLYSSNLAVPSSRFQNAESYATGFRLFEQTGCSGCHHPSFVTGTDEHIQPHLRNQEIWPFTDMLLHDMGEGLADLNASGFARHSEWRTAPLWGIGLAKMVNPSAGYLHDGRARTLEEAILWHDGEASESKQKFSALKRKNRLQLLKFIENL